MSTYLRVTAEIRKVKEDQGGVGEDGAEKKGIACKTSSKVGNGEIEEASN